MSSPSHVLYSFPDHLPVPNDTHELRVSSTAPTTNLGTDVEVRLREIGVCKLVAVGAGSVNQACKAIATARELLTKATNNEVDLLVLPEFTTVLPHGHTETMAVQLLVFAEHGPLEEEFGVGDTQEPVIRVGQVTSALNLGRTLATRIRNNPTHFATLQAVGPRSTNQAVKAIAHMREQLRQHSMDAAAVPLFVPIPIPNTNEHHTALQWRVYGCAIAEPEAEITGKAQANIEQKAQQEPQQEMIKTLPAIEGQPIPQDTITAQPTLPEAIKTPPILQEERPQEQQLQHEISA
eukprot:TRINITY_DN24958_c0_g1_i1.p1 TRINITY_DN24958_c0_g1~~TRINITY_DN24958_c0_g1_i1.p1  ORF type:complete len:307 (-),score=63.67 TRINITY_DN24958_c0_g1_i1:108-986(-)